MGRPLGVMCGAEKEAFRRHFQRALRGCTRRGFSVEECFGLIWEETIELLPLSEADQGQLYEEMIAWARRWVKSDKHPPSSAGPWDAVLPTRSP